MDATYQKVSKTGTVKCSSLRLRSPLNADSLKDGGTVLGVLQNLHGCDIPENLQNRHCEVPSKRRALSKRCQVGAPNEQDHAPILRVPNPQIKWETCAPWNIVPKLVP